jgi:hypothetical protein
MKHKLTEIDFDKINYKLTEIDLGTVINIKYNCDSLEFQTPKVVIQDIIKENQKEYLILKITRQNPSMKKKDLFLLLLPIELWKN